MTILLTEDSDEKAKAVEGCLRSSLSKDGLTVDRAKSFIGAVLKLQSVTYDLLLLDLHLPTRDGQLPATTGGKDVLAEIVKGQVRRPSHIICLTAYEDAAESVRDEADKTLVHVVFYQEDDYAWRDTLTAKAQYVERRLTHAATLPADYEADLAIV